MSNLQLMTGSCARCGHEFSRLPNSRYCIECMNPAARERERCLLQTRKAIKDGLIPPIVQQYCVDCGAFAEVYDHRDYGKPLEVDPVCRKCNFRRGPAVWLRAAA